MTAPSGAEEAKQLLAAAERDRVAFTILARDAQAPAEITLFLAQQALEKGSKAVLAARSAWCFAGRMICCYWNRWHWQLACRCRCRTTC